LINNVYCYIIKSTEPETKCENIIQTEIDDAVEWVRNPTMFNRFIYWLYVKGLTYNCQCFRDQK